MTGNQLLPFEIIQDIDGERFGPCESCTHKIESHVDGVCYYDITVIKSVSYTPCLCLQYHEDLAIALELIEIWDVNISIYPICEDVYDKS